MDDIFALIDDEKYDDFVALARQLQLDGDDYYTLIRHIQIIYGENEDIDDPMPQYYSFVRFIAPNLTDEQKNRCLVDFCSKFAPEVVKIFIENGADVHYNNDEPYKTACNCSNDETKRLLEERYGCC